ncbi:MAG: EamA family transporter [Pseudomonadota bacterium]
MTRNTATFVGFGAVLLWALLALLTVGSSPVPPFQLSAICFAIGGGFGCLLAMRRHKIKALIWQTPWQAWMLGVLGLFGYHALYFFALRLAPPAEAGLIAYLWPLLIVLFSGMLPGERLGIGHVVGAIMAFSGAALIIGQGISAFDPKSATGYGLAILCALTWSSYSVLSRRFKALPTDTVALFCVVAAVLSLCAHLATEETVRISTPLQWLSVAALGAGPVGLAFFLWDVGVKHGDIQLLGVASYAAPLLSTFLLVGTGFAPASPLLWVAAVLITAGAGVAAYSSSRAA